MKKYTVEITDAALTDMEQLYHHIAYVLQAPENAMAQYNRMRMLFDIRHHWPRESVIMEAEPERE